MRSALQNRVRRTIGSRARSTKDTHSQTKQRHSDWVAARKSTTMNYSESSLKKLVIAVIALLILTSIVFYNMGYHQSKVDTAQKYPIFNLKQEVFPDIELRRGMLIFYDIGDSYNLQIMQDTITELVDFHLIGGELFGGGLYPTPEPYIAPR